SCELINSDLYNIKVRNVGYIDINIILSVTINGGSQNQK
ncbi:hypothetical protein C5S29_09430, partial [ANME-1 cluster archaeon GoMg3.2]|nr:hypothetical protein [ANME-1 cluster archaeon GoMg3.2]